MFSHNDISIEGCCGSGKTWLDCALANAAIKQGKRVLYIRFSEMLENLGELEVKTIRTISREGSRILAENPELISDGKKALILAANKALTVIDNSGKITGELIQRLPVKIDLHSPDDIDEISLVCAALHYIALENGTDTAQAEIDTAEYIGSILMYEIWNLPYYKGNNEKPEGNDTHDSNEEFELAAETDGTHLTKLGVICLLLKRMVHI